MLEQVNLKQKLAREGYQAVMPALRARLTVLDAPFYAANLPIILIFEDWPAAGKGQTIGQPIKNLDPHWFTIVNTRPPTEFERHYPYLCRHWHTIPEAGRFSVMDRSWYQEVSVRAIADKLPAHTVGARLADIRRLGKTLTNDGYLILKFFLHISKREMKARLETLTEGPKTAFRVVKSDRKQVKHYDDCYAAFDCVLAKTTTAETPQALISGTDHHATTAQVFRTMVDAISERLNRPTPSQTITLPNEDIADAALRLFDVDLGQAPTREEYKRRLKAETAQLAKNRNLLCARHIPIVVGFKGWDAAGKGGCIKRLSSPLDARDYTVLPIAGSTPGEKKRHFPWRFYKRLPKSNHVAIFNRTWCGRVLVERIESFCNGTDWRRAYGEINVFEAYLQQSGALLAKFWIHISKKEQLKRFHARERIPEKQWKITAEDQRDREKWPRYETAVNDVFHYTSTENAPWHVLAGNDKYFARVQALRIMSEAIEARLKEKR